MVRTGDGVHDLVAELRDEVRRHAPADVVVHDVADGLAVGHALPFETHGAGSATTTRLWAVVRCDPATLTLRIEDVVTALEVDRPDAAVRWSTFRGRAVGTGAVAVYGRRPDGSVGRLGTRRRQGARALHDAVRGPATALGWREAQPLSATVGRVVGLVAGAGAGLTLVALAVLALTGRLA